MMLRGRRIFSVQFFQGLLGIFKSFYACTTIRLNVFFFFLFLFPILWVAGWALWFCLQLRSHYLYLLPFINLFLLSVILYNGLSSFQWTKLEITSMVNTVAYIRLLFHSSTSSSCASSSSPSLSSSSSSSQPWDDRRD